MSRSFSASSDNLGASITAISIAYIFGGWFYPTSFTTQLRLLSGDTSGAGGMFLRLSGTGGALQAQQEYSTTAATVTTSTTISTNKWWFIAMSYGMDLSTQPHVWIGDLATRVAEASYSSQTTGSGSLTSWNHVNVGNNDAGTKAFAGRIARPFLVAGRPAADPDMDDWLAAVQYGWLGPVRADGILRGRWDLSNADPVQNPNIGGSAAGLTRTGVTAAEEPPVPFLLAA